MLPQPEQFQDEQRVTNEQREKEISANAEQLQQVTPRLERGRGLRSGLAPLWVRLDLTLSLPYPYPYPYLYPYP